VAASHPEHDLLHQICARMRESHAAFHRGGILLLALHHRIIELCRFLDAAVSAEQFYDLPDGFGRSRRAQIEHDLFRVKKFV